MSLKSLDPRVSRMNLPESNPNEGFERQDSLNQWPTYEVFHQQSRGDQHVHVGIVHAPNPEIALALAKEQYARRMKCVNIWVVNSGDVFSTQYEDADIFEPATDKSYRESFGYNDTRAKIEEYKRRLRAEAGEEPVEDSAQETKRETAAPVSGGSGKKVVKKGIIVGKR